MLTGKVGCCLIVGYSSLEQIETVYPKCSSNLTLTCRKPEGQSFRGDLMIYVLKIQFFSLSFFSYCVYYKSFSGKL